MLEAGVYRYSPFLFKMQSVQSALWEDCLIISEMPVSKLVFEQQVLHYQHVNTPKAHLERIAF